MPDITEIRLPGVGVRHEFTTSGGERVAVVTHRSGRRDLMVYDRDDPDRCSTALHLVPEDSLVLAEALGAGRVSEAVHAVQHQLEGLAIDWVTVPPGSPAAGRTIGDGGYRTRTGASIVAVIRDDTTIPAPEPDFAVEVGDVVVAVGTPDGVASLRSLLKP